METAKIINNNKDFKPNHLPVLLKKMEERMMEKVVDKVTIEGVDFEIIEKPKTLYAGFISIAPDNESEPDQSSYERFRDGFKNIVDSKTPECMTVLSIGYRDWNHDCKRALLHGMETTNANQPEGITVIESPACTLIKVKSCDETWALTKKITGEDNPKWHMAPLFGLTAALFCTPEKGYEAGSEGNHETEYYFFDGSQYTTIPVHKR